MKLTLEQAADIHEILVIHCGADPYKYDDFEAVVTDENAAGEYRFGGAFGFGGKFYWRNGWKVDYYQENESKELRGLKNRANLDLALLFCTQTPLGLIAVDLFARYAKKYGSMVSPEFNALAGTSVDNVLKSNASPLVVRFREEVSEPYFLRILVNGTVIVERAPYQLSNRQKERGGKRLPGQFLRDLSLDFADPDLYDKLDARVDELVRKKKESLFDLSRVL